MLKKKSVLIAVISVIGLTLLAGCGQNSQSDPRKVVIELFGAMEKEDKATIAHLLDLEYLMRNLDSDYALSGDTVRMFTSPQEILDDLTEGTTKQRWFAYQRIIGESEILGDAATVEVTFVDKAQSEGYRTKFGVHKVNGKWKIFSFQTEE